MYEIAEMVESKASRVWPVGAQPLVLGRATPDSSPDIALDDPKVSRRHVRFFRKDEVLCIENISGNEVFVNAESLSDARTLGEGDAVEVFSHRFLIRKIRARPMARAGKRTALILSALVVSAAFLLIEFAGRRAGQTAQAGGNSAAALSAPVSPAATQGNLDYAMRLYDDRVSAPGGRYLALCEFSDLLNRSLPDTLRAMCRSRARSLDLELDSLYRQYWTLGDIAFRQKNFNACAEYFRSITLLIPDPRDKRYLRAQDVLRDLKSKGGNG